MGVKSSFSIVNQVNNVLLSHEKCQRKINERISYLWSSQCLQEFCGVHAWKWNCLSVPGTSVQPFGIWSQQNPERDSQKEFFHFFDWGTWTFLQISHLIAAAERFTLELNSTYLGKDKINILRLPKSSSEMAKLTAWKLKPILTRTGGKKGQDLEAAPFSTLLRHWSSTTSWGELKAFYYSKLKRWISVLQNHLFLWPHWKFPSAHWKLRTELRPGLSVKTTYLCI